MNTRGRLRNLRSIKNYRYVRRSVRWFALTRGGYWIWDRKAFRGRYRRVSKFGKSSNEYHLMSNMMVKRQHSLSRKKRGLRW